MSYGDDSEPLHSVQVPYQIEKINLMFDIEMGRGFIEKNNLRPLGKGPCDENPLHFASGKLAERPPCQRKNVRHLHRPFNYGQVLFPLKSQFPQMGRPSHHYNLMNDKGEKGREILGYHTDDLGEIISLYFEKVGTADLYAPLAGKQDLVDNPEKRGLAGSVGTYNAEKLTLINLE